MTWPLLLGLMLVSAGVAWYSVAAFIPLLHAKAARPAAITIAGALSLVAVLALASVPITEDGVWLLVGLAPWLVVAATPDTLVRVTGGPLPWDQTGRQVAPSALGNRPEVGRQAPPRTVAIGYQEAPADHAEALDLAARLRAPAGAP